MHFPPRRTGSGALLQRFAADERVQVQLQNSGEIRWFLFWPDAEEAAGALMRECIATLNAWGVSAQTADGSPPVPGVYGVPQQWPHVVAAYERAGFVHEGRTEIVHLAKVADLPAAQNALSPTLWTSTGAAAASADCLWRRPRIGCASVTLIGCSRTPRPKKPPVTQNLQHAGFSEMTWTRRGWRRRLG